MTKAANSARRLFIVDDDLLTREVLSLLATQAGFEGYTFDSGEAVLEALTQAPAPDIILCDMQMTGISGDSLARLMRSACPAATLFAMSGSAVPAPHLSAFDGFLLKPFSIEDLCAALDRRTAAPLNVALDVVLSEDIFASLSKAMTREQVRQLYAMSLDDADHRIVTIREAEAANDHAAYRRAAHSIKGGCGMVGALELARLAGRMEERGPRPHGTAQIVDNADPCDQFLMASAHLRRILDVQLK